MYEVVGTYDDDAMQGNENENCKCRRAARAPLYPVGRPLSRQVLFCFLSEVLVTNRAAQQLQYQPNVLWEMSKSLYKILRLSGCPML